MPERRPCLSFRQRVQESVLEKPWPTKGSRQELSSGELVRADISTQITSAIRPDIEEIRLCAAPGPSNLTHPREAAACPGSLCAPARPPAAVEQAPAARPDAHDASGRPRPQPPPVEQDRSDALWLR